MLEAIIRSMHSKDVLKTVTNIVAEHCKYLLRILILYKELMNNNILLMYSHYELEQSHESYRVKLNE